MRMADLQDRKAIYELRRDRIKAALMAWMQDAGAKTIQRPEATLSVRQGSPQVIYTADFSVDALPKTLVRKKVEADKAAIKKALQAGDVIIGAELQSNVPPSLSIRTK
jgi:hypothetical protein